MGALAPGRASGILGRRSPRPQLSPQALTGSSGRRTWWWPPPPPPAPRGIHHTLHKSVPLTSPAHSLHPKLFTLPPWPSIMRLPDATAANTPTTPWSEMERLCVRPHPPTNQRHPEGRRKKLRSTNAGVALCDPNPVA